MSVAKLLARGLLIVTLFFSAASVAQNEAKPPNFLILIGDDMGVETLSCYGVGSQPARTPTLDNLCNSGVRFDNFWSQPVCSPTRATILSGEFGFRNGVGTPARGPDLEYPVPDTPAGAPEETGGRGGVELPETAAENRGERQRGTRDGGRRNATNNPAERPGYTQPADERPGLRRETVGLPRALKTNPDNGYRTAAVGKWHLADKNNGGLDHPQVVGFDHYAGSINSGSVESYFAWSKVIDGTITDGQTGYATSATVDDAISWLNEGDEEKPWLLWVAFNAPHSPFGNPPENLLSAETREALSHGADERVIYGAMIEAMDTEIGRLLASVDPDELENTYVIFLGDNGTPSRMATEPFRRDQLKGTIYQGGVNVPLLIDGPQVNGRRATKALANSVDLYATVLDLAGVAAGDGGVDSVSLAPVLANDQQSVREFAYADVYGPQAGRIVNSRAIRNDRYKLLVDLQNDTRELYDLANDPYEKRNLLDDDLGQDAQSALDDLDARLQELVAGD